MPLPPEVSALLTDAGKAAAVGLISYIAHGVRTIKLSLRTQDERLTKVEHVVWGVDRDNGLKSVTRDTEGRVDALERAVDRLQGRAA